jgi:hypothetical protein
MKRSSSHSMLSAAPCARLPALPLNLLLLP